MSEQDSFVAEGRTLLESTEEYRRKRAEVEAAVRARYAEALARADLLEKLRLHLRIQREIGREVEKLAPGCGCYLAQHVG